MDDRTYRMYSLVLRQLSPIQKGVQTAHSVVEFANKFGDTPEYHKWANTDKTLIMLDGGTYQEMEELKTQLTDAGIRFATFEEEDLNNLTTSITLIADDRVWDRKTYIDWDPSLFVCGRSFFLDPPMSSVNDYDDWLNIIGGEKNEILRGILGNLRLSM